MQLVASRCAAGPMPRSTQRSHSPLIRPGGGRPSGYIPTKRGRRLHSWCGSPSQHTRAQQRPALIEQDAEQLSATHPVQLSAVTRHSDTQERGARRCECPNVPDFPAARLWRRHAPQPCTGPLTCTEVQYRCLSPLLEADPLHPGMVVRLSPSRAAWWHPTEARDSFHQRTRQQ